MQDITLIGIDLGKHSFHVHGQDRHGKAMLCKKFNRKQLIDFFVKLHSCKVVMEACAGAHHMARQLMGFGHEVKLISPQFVRPFVKSNKNDFVDAEAICEAASRPSMRFVTPKSEAQQTLSALHRIRRFAIVIIAIAAPRRICFAFYKPFMVSAKALSLIAQFL
jgi:transposase